MILKEVRRRGSADSIIGMLPAHPVLDVKAAAQFAGVVCEAARLAMDQLEHAGSVRVINARRRDRVYETPALFELVDDFERQLATPARGTRPARRAPRRRVPS